MKSNTFRTEIKLQTFDFDINYQTKIMFAGSCFTENIGNKLAELKFNVNINPFGIIYNPVSLAKSLDFIVDKRKFSNNDLIFFNEYWHSFYHHGKFSETDKNKVLKNINKSISEANKFIYNADILFITLGTAWVYEFSETKEIVANCHKIPGNKFNKKLLTETEIVNNLNYTVEKIKKHNKKLKIIFSISPVRHLKDGFSENFLSKAILRTAVNEICRQNNDVFYFPAYEILIDDLRDYRFYASDMVHPNEAATEYIFNLFKNAFFDKETLTVSEEIKKINLMKQHRIFDTGTEQFEKFISSALKKISETEKKYPFLNFDDEKNYFLSVK